jgi:hypothetical protein
MLVTTYQSEPNSSGKDNERLDDERLDDAGNHQAQAALAASPVVDLRELRVVREGSHLLISGRVDCFYHKQLAQETVRPHAENLQLVNQVTVLVNN